MQIPSDDQIGKNLATLRGQVTQQELGEKMRQRGFKWSQATVWDVERGKRPLRLTEALEVVAILNKPGVTVESLWADPAELRATRELKSAFATVREKWENTVWAIQQLLASHDAMREKMDRVSLEDLPPIAETRITRRPKGAGESQANMTQTQSRAESVADWMRRSVGDVSKLTVESAVEKGQSDHDETPSPNEIEAAGDWYASMHGEELRGK